MNIMPYPKLLQVTPEANYKLLLTYHNDKKMLFDALPYLDKGIYRQLLDVELFNTVKVAYNTVEWANGADFDPESLYLLSQIV